MNEVGLNAKWLGEDMTSNATQKFHKRVLNHMRERLQIIKRNMVIYIILKQHLQSQLLIV